MNSKTVAIPRDMATALANAQHALTEAQEAYDRQRQGEFLSESERTQCMLGGEGFMQDPVSRASSHFDKVADAVAVDLFAMGLHDGQPKKAYYDTQVLGAEVHQAERSIGRDLMAQSWVEIPHDLACALAAVKVDVDAASDEYSRLNRDGMAEAQRSGTEVTWALTRNKKIGGPLQEALSNYRNMQNEVAHDLIAAGCANR